MFFFCSTAGFVCMMYYTKPAISRFLNALKINTFFVKYRHTESFRFVWCDCRPPFAVASCLHAEHALITSLTAREDIHTIPVDEVGQTVNVSVRLRVKKIIELVRHDYIGIIIIPIIISRSMRWVTKRHVFAPWKWLMKDINERLVPSKWACKH